MSKKEKRILAFLAVTALTLGVAPRAEAMHIMEGYLPGGYCIAWGVLCLPFLAAGFFAIRKTLQERRNLITLLAMSGAFIFVISSLKIPSVTGSCSHMTGTGLGAILFGPAAVSVLGLIVLLFQALLLGHGGLTTIGANTFSMAIAGPFVSWGIYLLCQKLKVNKRRDRPADGSGTQRRQHLWRSAYQVSHRLRSHPDPPGRHRGHYHGSHRHGSGDLRKAGA